MLKLTVISFSFCLFILNDAHSQKKGLYLQISPQLSVMTKSNISSYDQNTLSIPNINIINFAHCSGGIRLGLNYYFKLKDSFFVNIGSNFSNFSYKLNQTTTVNGVSHFFDLRNLYGNFDLELSLIKSIQITSKKQILLSLGGGYCALIPLISSMEDSYKTDNGFTGSLSFSVNNKKMQMTPEVIFGIRLLNSNLVNDNFQFGLTYHWLFRKIQEYEVINVVNDYYYRYKFNPSISLISGDIIFKL